MTRWGTYGQSRGTVDVFVSRDRLVADYEVLTRSLIALRGDGPSDIISANA